MKKFSSFILGTIMLPAVALANPAKPGLHTLRQADGSIINVELRGDEHHHVYLSEDGYPLFYVDGTYYFATIDPSGDLVASHVAAVNPAVRDSATKAFVARLDREALVSAASARPAEFNFATRAEVDESIPGRFDYRFPTTGSPRVLVILAEYSDLGFTLENPYEYFHSLITEKGFTGEGNHGCCLDYFYDNSLGRFTPEIDVYGPIKLPKTQKYYGGNEGNRKDRNAYKMIPDACAILDDEIDFSLYDVDGDGVVENVYLFYAGEGESSGGGADTVWPFSWNLTQAEAQKAYTFDGVQIDRFACSNEWEKDHPDGIGTFCHEFSHVLGLGDIYSSQYVAGVFSPGKWDILDIGSSNDNSRTPPNYSVFERYALGWLEPEELQANTDYELQSIEHNVGYIVHTDNPNEFFMFENRQQQGWDASLPWHGMLIWHIDFVREEWDNNNINNNPKHQYVDLIEADNIQTETTRMGDCFPGRSKVTSFTAEGRPAFKSWSGRKIELPITEIAETEEGTITFKVGGSTSVATIGAAEGFAVAGRMLTAASPVTVADASGRVLFSGTGDWQFPADGLYIVGNGKENRKIMVK